MGIINYDLDKVDTTQQFLLGSTTQRNEHNQVFKYVEYEEGTDSVAGVAGQLVIGLDAAYVRGRVTMDYSAAGLTGIPADPVGFLQVE